MSKTFKTVLIILIATCFLTGIIIAGFGCYPHPDPVFNIGNNFSETVTVYFNGYDVGKIKAGASNKFYPNEVLTKTDQSLQLDIKTDSGTILFSKVYTWDELIKLLESVHGNPYWIGPETK